MQSLWSGKAMQVSLFVACISLKTKPFQCFSTGHFLNNFVLLDKKCLGFSVLQPLEAVDGVTRRQNTIVHVPYIQIPNSLHTLFLQTMQIT